MNCLFHASSCSASLYFKTGQFISRSSQYGFYSFTWKRSLNRSGASVLGLKFVYTTVRVQCFSSRRGSASRSRKLDSKPVMEEEKDAFFVVRKGDVVGVYKSFSDCEAQVGSSICDPPVSVYKGYSLPKDTEEYLTSRGLRNAIYSIRASDLKDDIFGTLIPCPFQQPSSSTGELSSKDILKKKSHELLESAIMRTVGPSSPSTDPSRKQIKLHHYFEAQEGMSAVSSCILQFDGASKGNPGQAGAGAVLRGADGSLICRLREGLGIATNNYAEYRGMILGLKYALKKGFTSISVRGDSRLVCMQVQGQWKVKNQNMSDLCEEAKNLKNKFLSFQITHVLRDLNSEADVQANLAANLADGEIQEEYEE